MKFESFLVVPLFSALISTSPLPDLGLANPLPLETRQSAAPSGVDVNAETDKWLFSTPMASFLSALSAKSPPYLFWPDPRADACTWAADYPWDFDFKRSCQRHDFGYKNYRDEKRFCRAGRDAIDAQFARDLNDYCNTRKWWKRPLCYGTAKTYAAFVRLNNPPYSQECSANGPGIGGSGRDANGRCLPGATCN